MKPLCSGEFIDQLNESQAAQNQSNQVIQPQPRILAVMDPVPASLKSEDTSKAALYKTCLLAQLKKSDNARVVERDNLPTLLNELHLSATDLSDPVAQLSLGKVYPASAVLLLQVISVAGDESITCPLN